MRIQVSMPVYGDVHAGTVSDLVSLIQFSSRMGPMVMKDYPDPRRPFDIWVTIIRNSALSKSRSQLVGIAKDREASHLFWLDADMRFPQNLLLQLLKHQKPIVGCNYKMRQGDHEPIVERHGERITSGIGRPELEDVDTLGFGVLLTETSVFEKIEQPFDLYQRPDGEWLDESMSFSDRARYSGFKLWVDHWNSLAVGHVGEETYTFEDDIPDVIRCEP